MAFVWSKELETGNPKIDEQHKQLVLAFNNLMDACSLGKGRTEIENTLDFLCNYTVRHFSDEENLQNQYSYPEYTNHKRLHDEFKAYVGKLAAELKNEGPTVALVGKLNSGVGNWLVNHIKREDTKIAEHIRNAK